MPFAPLTAYLDSLLGEGVPGAEILVRKDRKEVYSHRIGTFAPNVPLDRPAYYWFYSMTKPLTMTITLQQIEKGLLKLSDPVADYLPAYGSLTVQTENGIRPARTVLTVEHLMAMQGGLDYELEVPEIIEVMKANDMNASNIDIANALARRPLHFDPGCGFRYSMCHDVLAAVLEVATGKPLSRLMEEGITGPLGIRELSFHPSAGQLAQLAAQYNLMEDGTLLKIGNDLNPVFSMPRYESGGAGLMGTIADYMQFADCLSNGGTDENGYRILTQASIDEMRRNRQHGQCMDDFKKIGHKVGYGYGLGVRTLMDGTTSRSPLGEFGWDGAAGAYVLMDPVNHLTIVYAHHVLNMNQAYYVFHPKIRDLVYEALDL